MGDECHRADGSAHLSDPQQGEAPQLGRAILETKAGGWPCFQTTLEKDVAARRRAPVDLRDKAAFAKDLSALLLHVQERIQIGLDEAWLGPHGYAWRPPPTLDKCDSKQAFEQEVASQYRHSSAVMRLFWDDPDEAWARAMTQTFLFLMYGGPNVQYSHAAPSANDLPESTCYQRFPAFYPLSVACQHLATYAVLGRGRTIADMKGGGLSCNGASAKLQAFPEGVQFDKTGYWGADAVTTEVIARSAAPGDALFINFHGPASIDQLQVLSDADKKAGIKDVGTVHVGTVLRKWGGRIQFLDTGVLLSSEVPTATEGGTSDHAWVPSKVGRYGQSVGMGIMGKAPGDLKALARKIERARPLAVARLVIMDEQTRDVVTGFDAASKKATTSPRTFRVRYASRLLHLWLDGAGIPLSKLLWSLRDPPVTGLTLAWFVYLPKGPQIARFLDDDAPEKPVASLLQPGATNALYDTNVVLGLGGGRVASYARFAEKGKQGDRAGWSRDFGTEVPEPSDAYPWVAPRLDGVPDAKLPASLFQSWSTDARHHGSSYRVEDPAAVGGAICDDPVGVPLFDQGR